MKKLQTRINKLEKKIELENSLLKMQLMLLKDKFSSPKVILVGALASFTIGFLLTRKKSTALLLHRLSRSTITLFRMYRRLKFLLPTSLI